MYGWPHIRAPAQLGITLALGHARYRGQMDDAVDAAQAIPQMTDVGDVARGVRRAVEWNDAKSFSAQPAAPVMRMRNSGT